MTDTLGEDRLLLESAEQWCKEADQAVFHSEHWAADELPELEPDEKVHLLRHQLELSLGRETGRSVWLARLCARVRHLERDAAIRQTEAFLKVPSLPAPEDRPQ